MFALVCCAPHQLKSPCKVTKKINRWKTPAPIISVKFHEIVYVADIYQDFDRMAAQWDYDARQAALARATTPSG